MQNLLQTHSISWAQSVRLALESEGIRAVVLDENTVGHMGLAGRVRVAVPDDADLARAQTVLARLTPPFVAPPSWRWQKRGLQLLALGLVLIFVTAALFDRYEPGPVTFAALGLTVLVFVAGFVLIALGWRADKADDHVRDGRR